jgi:hypothetical protein
VSIVPRWPLSPKSSKIYVWESGPLHTLLGLAADRQVASHSKIGASSVESALGA